MGFGMTAGVARAHPDYSKIGRRSRRKGKSFEREVAGILRELTGKNWQTTRNSGRTDLKGDVYCSDFPALVVECKHRKTWTVKALLLANKVYLDEIIKVEEHALGCPLIVFCKNDAGIWVLFRGVDTGLFDFAGARIFGKDGRIWYEFPKVGEHVRRVVESSPAGQIGST